MTLGNFPYVIEKIAEDELAAKTYAVVVDEVVIPHRQVHASAA